MTKRRSTNNAAETSQKPAPPDREVKWGGFIDIRMKEGDKEKYESWVAGIGDTFWELFENCLVGGYKFSVSWDDENDCFIATFTKVMEWSELYRYTLTSRAGEWEKSLSLLMFKHYVLLDQNWATFKPSTGRGAEI